ncbi:MAG: YfhO family protein [Gaiellaceae bacterium]
MTEPAFLDAVTEVQPEARAEVRSRRGIQWSDLAGLLVSCLLVVVVFSPVLFGGRTLSTASEVPGTNGLAPFPGQPNTQRADFRADPAAQSWAAEPSAKVAHRAYADRELPLWNPYQGAGAPLAANMQSAVFDPLLLAVNLHPTPLTWDLCLIGAFLLGAAAGYLFGRVLGLQVIPAVVSSAAFSLSGWFFLYDNNQFSRSYVFLPVLFLLVELTPRSRRWWPVLGLGVAVAENIYIGMPEASFFVIGAAAIYGAVRLVQQRKEMPVRVSLARLGGGGLLGLLLAAPVLLLFLQYERLSFNVHKPEFSAGSQIIDYWGVLRWIVPYFVDAGVPTIGWFGAAVVIAALAAVSGRTETKRCHAWLFLALGIFLLAKIYDLRVTQTLTSWVGRLPGAELVIFPTFAAPVVSFAFAVLAGIGVQVLWTRDLHLKRFLALLAAAFALSVAFWGTDRRWHVITDSFSLRSWSQAAFFAAAAVAAVVLAARLRWRWGVSILAVVIISELFVLAPFRIYQKRADPFRTPGWMTLVRTAQASDPNARVFGTDGKLYPNTAGALGLQDIRFLDALYVERYWRYVQAFIEPSLFDRFTGIPVAFGSEAGPAHFQDNPMFDVLGVRAVLSRRSLARVPGFRLVGRDLDTRVYENTRAFPRAWVVHRIHIARDEDEAFRILEARSRRRGGTYIVDRFDPRREAVVEPHAKTPSDSLDALPADSATCRPGDRATIRHYSATHVTVGVEASCAGLLVLSDTYFPGWTAKVNGRERPIYPTDGALRGLIVPKGTSRVDFRYEPRQFSVGIVLALAGLAGFAGVAFVAGWRRRARRVESSASPARP